MWQGRGDGEVAAQVRHIFHGFPDINSGEMAVLSLISFLS